jgi:hypothetical protein
MELYKTFTVKDSQGNFLNLHELREYADASRTGAPSLKALAHRDLRLEDGHHVTRMHKGEYVVDETHEKLVADDPEAP